MKLGTDGMRPHVQGCATPADIFGRTTGPLRKWSERFTMETEPLPESMLRRRWKTRWRR